MSAEALALKDRIRVQDINFTGINQPHRCAEHPFWSASLFDRGGLFLRPDLPSAGRRAQPPSRMALARPLSHDQRFQAILVGDEHGVMLKVNRDTRHLMVATQRFLLVLDRQFGYIAHQETRGSNVRTYLVALNQAPASSRRAFLPASAPVTNDHSLCCS